LAQGNPELNPATAVTVGRVLSAHGVRGELKVQPLSDFPGRFASGARLWLKGSPVRIERSRPQGRILVLKLEGIDDRNAAEDLHDQELLVPEAAPLDEEGVYYQHDIIGMTARDPEGTELGIVKDVFSTGSNDVYVIEGERGQLLVPALDDVVRVVDVPNRTMTIELMEGLEFQGGPKQRAAPKRTYGRRKPQASRPDTAS
jgi:16S rRNA processing protein RimM